ncbi:MAG: hypothetical protein A2499_16300 [Stygiobacter sp. RIFOXYC12_FULL_38_8]|nr:MAG: hypothetical protein A2279_06295 [Stygiobacter sp. RIFOXYA12_FULL_38_9]OGV07028.1 MAG: hypothetical protein A2299_03580 [Stygiobacter sp. RIFOXYB2_FULL_37_11]OGV10713.1 MAG: hypothetical protein A2237_10385 [Stygiobacter sp. RIFOXYA2_FULL_38_8]OGV12457.1 MAG: hypothetical protein A2440_14475 [Stygiobacter sp. RIFOXYC2_FULL_38_25]OGV24086.1 MAG: hypothetical protein A2499_16300 [Stygiobacter sp. RIFOXYC12_FULL_38_8]OGV78720.1 MAG: hypothetical protein A2X65_08640 [Stygiobacter sp. GWF2_
MKKHFEFKSDKQVFRILITETDKLLIETRDTTTKEVSFHCYDLQTGDCVFSNYQLEEKTWLGIEAIYKDVIYFHKFPKPDLPGHKEIIALDIASQKVLWHNNENAFLFAYQDKVYSFTQGFEDRYFLTLDYMSGEQKENLGSDYTLVNSLRAESDIAKDWSCYVYPELNLSTADETTMQTILNFTRSFSVKGEIEWASINELLMFSFHAKEKDEKLTNRFVALNKNSTKTIMAETLNENVTALLTDSFFVYMDFLFLLKEKNEVVVYVLRQDQD